MTASRSRAPKERPRRRAEQEQATSAAPIDNRGEGLEEGNDFA